MNAKDLVKENNRKRELLNEENLKDYEEMLLYIRMNNKSEQQTEEILMELLDHLLEAQASGKTARDIFGDDLKTYSQELIKELPKETKKNQTIFLIYLGLNLLGLVGMVIGITNFAMYQLFNLGTERFEIALGTGVTVVIIDLLLLALFIYIIIRWINGSLFKKKTSNKWLEFLQIWVISTVFIGLTVLVLMYMPAFGSMVSISHFVIVLGGLVLYIASRIMNKKFRLTK